MTLLGPKRDPKPAPDPSEKLANARHEAFALALCAGATQYDAYLACHPKAKRWKRASVDQEASKLVPKISPRLAWLQQQAADAATTTLHERKSHLSTIERVAVSTAVVQGPDGPVLDPDVGPAMAGVAVRAIKEHNRMDGAYPKEPAHEIKLTGGVDLVMLLSRVAQTPRGLPREKIVAGVSKVIDVTTEPE